MSRKIWLIVVVLLLGCKAASSSVPAPTSVLPTATVMPAITTTPWEPSEVKPLPTLVVSSPFRTDEKPILSYFLTGSNLEELSRDLNLSPDQAAQIEVLVQEEAQALGELRRTYKNLSVEEFTTKVLEIARTSREGMAGILAPEQYEEFLTWIDIKWYEEGEKRGWWSSLTSKPEMREYVDPVFGYQLSYPAGMGILPASKPEEETVIESFAEHDVYRRVGITVQIGPQDTTAANAAAIMLQALLQDPRLSDFSGITERLIGGYPAAEISYMRQGCSFSLELESVCLRTRERNVFIVANGNIYTFHFSVNSIFGLCDATLDPIFDQILESFQPAMMPSQGTRRGEIHLTVTPAIGTVGTKFTLSGLGFVPGEEVAHWLVKPDGTCSDPGLELADEQGKIYVSLYAWTDIEPGHWGWTAQAASGDTKRMDTVYFEIVAPTPVK